MSGLYMKDLEAVYRRLDDQGMRPVQRQESYESAY